MPVQPDDYVSRSVLDPKDYRHGGMLDLGIGFVFPTDGDNCESVYCNRLLDNDPVRIHSVGKAREGADRKGVFHTYKGYVEGRVEDITSIRAGTYYFTVFLKDDEGPAHCHVKMHYPERNKQYRTTAISRLVQTFSDLIPAT